MAKVYAELIRKGLKSIDDVPENLIEEVRSILGIGPENREKNGADGV